MQSSVERAGYVAAECDILILENADIVTASGASGGTAGTGGNMDGDGGWDAN